MPPQTTALTYTSYFDLTEHALDYLGGTPDVQTNRDCARAILQSYRDVTNARLWQYLLTQGQIITDPPYQTGTIAYQHTGGASPRLVTLTGGTWPTPMIGGEVGPGWMLRVDTATFQVESRISPNQLTLTQDVNPGHDLAAGTPYILYHDGYLLPSDFIKQDTSIYEGNFGGLEYTDLTYYLWWQRYILASGTPRYFCITGSRLRPGRLEVRIFPYPVDSKTVNFVYQRRPRDLAIANLSTGTVSVTSGGKIVTANGFAFPPNCVGSLLRLGTLNTIPTSWIGTNPPGFETYIRDWTSPAVVVVNDASPVTGQYKYMVSDPIDVEQTSMLTPVLRGVEKYLQMARNIQGKPDAAISYAMALKEAQASDSRSFQGKALGEIGPRRSPWKYMPADFGV